MNSQVELRKVHNSQLLAQVLYSAEYEAGVELGDLNPEQVFTKCLILNAIPEEQQKELLESFCEVLATLENNDVRAE